MFDGITDEDDAFFTPVPSSNLASLFGVSVAQPDTSSGNTSLTYTAPVQPPKKGDGAKNISKSKHQSSVIVFKEVHAFKIVDKNYLDQRKCGLALIGNDTVQVYQLLLYKQKNDIISSTKISKEFQFIILNDNYSSFCDDQKQNWTIHFNSDSDISEFISTLESRGGKIVHNEKDKKGAKPPETKDTVDKELPKQIDSDNQSDTSSSNVKANILSRMAKMGQKLLPNTSVSDGTDSDTEREKSIHNKNRKVKRNANTNSPTSSTNTAAEIAKKPSVNLPPRTNTMVGQPYIQPFGQRYSIINGIPVIQPVYGQISAEPNNSQPQFAPMPIEPNTSCHSILPVENVSSPMMYNQLVPPPYDQLQMYFSENRTHNSEVRMNILRLTNKMEEVLDKVQKIDINNTSSDSKDNILKEENEKLKSHIKKLEDDLQTSKQEQQKLKDEFTKKEETLLKENNELQKNIEKQKDDEKEYEDKIKDLKLKIQEYEEASVDKTQADGDKTNERNEKVEECVKRIMNNLYYQINNEIQDDESALGKDIKNILAQKIRDNTYSIISAVNELSVSK